MAEAVPNFAPLPPLVAAKKSPATRKVDLVEWINELREEMRQEKNSEEWRKRRLASQKNDLFYRGYQDLRPAEFSNSWRIMEPKPVLFILNEFQFWVNVNVMKWNAARVDYRVKGLHDGPDAAAAAAKVEQIARYYDDRDWTRTEVIEASKMCQFEGHLVAYVYHDPNYSSRKAFRPVTERQSVKLGESTARCADCGMVGEAAQEQCAHCGSMSLAVAEVPEFEAEMPTGEQEEYTCGDVCHRLISIYNIVWKSRLGLAKSDVVLWEEEYAKEELEATYEGLDIPDAGTSDEGLRVKAQLENAGRSRDSKNRHVLSRMWVEPNRYKSVELRKDVETVSGAVLPAGTKLSAVFPKGFHAILLGDTIVDLYPAVKNDDLCLMEYHGVPNGLAQGVDAMCEPQRQMNTGNSLLNLWMRHQAAPPLTFVNGVVDPGDLSGDLTRPIPIEGANLSLYPGVTPENAIQYRTGTPANQGIFVYLDRLRSAIQFAAHAIEFSDGLPNTDNETLGGARIAQGMAQALSGVHLSQWADFRANLLKLKLKKFKQYCWAERYIDFGGEYGILEGQMLSGMDVPDEFQIETVPNSWLPRVPEQQQANFQALLMAVGGPAGLLTTPPAFLAQMCEIFDVRLTENHYPATLRTVRNRIQQAKMLLPALQQAQLLQEQAGMLPPMQIDVDPMTGMQSVVPVSMGQMLFEGLQPSFNPREDGLDIAAEYLSKWLTTDEGLEADPAVIEFAGVLQDACIQSFQMQQMVRGGIAAAGAPPMPAEQPGQGKSGAPAQSKGAPQPNQPAAAPVGG